MEHTPNSRRVAGSFRDPSGFVYSREDALYRQVNPSYRAEYDALVSSGLLERLWRKGLLVEHTEADLALAATREAYRVLRPARVPFISYPYEWAFSAYRDAALATLDIQTEALACGLTLKDASAYNMQFVDGRPVLIDTLSFERYEPGTPWVAYRQFCQHFVAPLALMARKDVRLGMLMKGFIDGVPLDLASALLGSRSKWSPRLLLHIHAHAKSQRRHAQDGGRASANRPSASMGSLALRGILDSLRATIISLKWSPVGTEWTDYYTFTNYTDAAFEAKRAIVEEFLATANPRSVWDLGANNGEFSRLASRRRIPTVAFDIDPGAVEKNYRQVRRDKEAALLPLVQDLTNPSASIGWAGTERDSLTARGPADMAFALALVHHLAISNNVPLQQIAEFLASVCHHLVIEFVPKEDSQVQKLLASRKDIFPDYTQDGFEAAFATAFKTRKRVSIASSSRTLYWMSRR